jgi:hypothetical protein
VIWNLVVDVRRCEVFVGTDLAEGATVCGNEQIAYRTKVQFKLSDKAFEGHGVGDDKNDPRSSSVKVLPLKERLDLNFVPSFSHNKRFRREEGVSSDEDSIEVFATNK